MGGKIRESKRCRLVNGAGRDRELGGKAALPAGLVGRVEDVRDLENP